MQRARSRHPARPPVPVQVICAGGILGLATILASVFNAVSGPQSVALALTSGLTIGGGLLGQIAASLLPEGRTAWRRGFRHGLEAGRRAQAMAPPDIPAQPGSEAADHRPGHARGEVGPPPARDDRAGD